MINYLLLALGIFAILVSLILIFLDQLKGEDIYFSMDVKEQEIKKVIEDADEIIAELNYTSEMVVKDIEEKLSGLKEELKKLSVTSAAAAGSVSEAGATAEKKEASQPLLNVRKKKKITNDNQESSEVIESKLNSKQQAVFDYADQGMSVTDIAKKLNIGQGEVMLILSLNNEVE